MLYAVVAVYAALIFPISANFTFCLKGDKKRAYIGMFLYEVLPIIRGVIFYKKGCLFFLKGKKEIKIEPSIRRKIKAKIKPFYDFNITETIFFYRLGGVKSAFYTAIMSTFTEKIVKSVFGNIKTYLKIKNYFDIYTEKKTFDLDIRIKMRFNLLVITLSLIKTLINFLSEKINEKHGKRRQNKTDDRIVA